MTEEGLWSQGCVCERYNKSVGECASARRTPICVIADVVKASISEEITPMFTISPLISSYVAELFKLSARFSALVRPFKLFRIVPSVMLETGRSAALFGLVALIRSSWVPTFTCQEATYI